MGCFVVAMATRAPRIPTMVIAILGACSPDSGPEATSSTGDAGSSGDLGVCGDGVVGPGESCDPPGDGCTADCQNMYRAPWTITRGSPEAPAWIHDVAVDPAGRIIVLGATRVDLSSTGWLLALDPAGNQLWTVQLSSEVVVDEYQPHLAVDADGIYVQGHGVHGFTPIGAPMWSMQPPDRIFTTLAVADGALYAAGSIYDEKVNLDNQPLRIVADRIDAATGEVAWDRVLGDDSVRSIATGVAVTTNTVLVVGTWSLPADSGAAFIALDAATGTSGPPVIDAGLTYVIGLDKVPTGDLVLAGYGSQGMLARRFGVDGEIRWTADIDLEVDGRALAVAADERVVLVGKLDTPTGPHGFLRGLSSAGETAWTLDYVPEDTANAMVVSSAAFGPDFFVAGGQEYRNVDGGGTAWVRRIEIDGAMP